MGKKTENGQSLRNRIVGEGMEAPADLLANPQNWRRHPREQLAALEGMLEAVGWVQRVIVNRTTGRMVDGHARVELAIKRNEAAVPVLFVELTPDEERVVLAGLDPIGGLAETDQAMLDGLLDGLESGNADLDAFLSSLRGEDAGGTEGLTDPDDAPAVQERAVSAAGEVWLLGRHRIICGSSTDEATVEKVLAGVKPHLMVTDPPYGVEYDPKWRLEAGVNKAHQKRAEGVVLNDDKSDWREAWALFPGDVAYVWHGGLHAANVAESLSGSGFSIRSQIIWAKSSLVMGRGHYHWQHEPCWYAVRDKGTGHWSGDHKQSTLWQIANMHRTQGSTDDGKTNHSTQKPVECMKRPIENNSSPGQAVYEPFSGSGTTIIAAEMTGRCCYAVELNPPYVDMAVRRWQAFTGQAATLEGDGRTFAEIEADRLAAEVAP